MRLSPSPLSSLSLAALLLWATPSFAAIEIGRADQSSVTIRDVYQRDGVAFVAIDEVLGVLGLSGQWDNVAHLYRIETPKGQAVISPGSSYLRLGERAVKVAHRPRFIDGKLRVSEPFLVEQFAPFLDLPLELNNLNPAAPPPPESPLDQLFLAVVAAASQGGGRQSMGGRHRPRSRRPGFRGHRQGRCHRADDQSGRCPAVAEAPEDAAGRAGGHDP